MNDGPSRAEFAAFTERVYSTMADGFHGVHARLCRVMSTIAATSRAVLRGQLPYRWDVKMCATALTYKGWSETRRPAWTSVLCLFLRGCPANIARLIVAVIVDPFKRVIERWTRPDISDKDGDRIAPRLAHANAASAVVLVALCGWVGAPRIHRFPARIFRSVGKAVAVASPFPETFARETSATLGVALSQRLTIHARFSSAVTATDPHARVRRCASDGDQASKTPTSDVDCRHGLIIRSAVRPSEVA